VDIAAQFHVRSEELDRGLPEKTNSSVLASGVARRLRKEQKSNRLVPYAWCCCLYFIDHAIEAPMTL
jgi:hypothetical protein